MIVYVCVRVGVYQLAMPTFAQSLIDFLGERTWRQTGGGRTMEAE